MSFKKFSPYNLKKDINVKKNMIESRCAGSSGLSGGSKRDVYPQFSEPEDYEFTRPRSTNDQRKRPNSSQNKQHFMGMPWANTQLYKDDSIQNLGHTVPLHQPMPTFRQYLEENTENEQMLKHTNKQFKMSGTKASHNVISGNISGQITHISEESRETMIPQKRNSKGLIGTRIRHLLGSVDQVVRWHKMAKRSELELHYEVAGILESTINKEGIQLLLIRSESGHRLQGVFYTIDRELPKLPPGTRITVTGNMIGSNKIHIFDMNLISREDSLAVQRLAFLCQRALEGAL